MEPQRNSKYASIISVDSKRSNISSCRSLERPSWNSKDHSLSKNKSLVEVMSIEDSRKSDIYQKMLAQDNNLFYEYRKSNPININSKPFKSGFKAEVKDQRRFSYEKENKINHICLCYLNCLAQSCPCADAIDEECIQDLCCRKCIEVKAQRKQKKDKIFCTCKKTKCNKKYCTCFSAGVKCGRYCSCEDCANCDKVEKMEIEPVCKVDKQIQAMPFPQHMQFEPFSFRYSYNS